MKKIIKCITLSCLITACAMTSVESIASTLNIANNSKNDLELCFQNKCSSDFMIPAHTIKNISLDKLNKECSSDKQNCEADVFVDNSDFKKIATIGFDMSYGVKSIKNISEFDVSANGFNLFFKGPWK